MLYDKKWEIKDVVKPKLAGWQQVLLNAADLIEEKGWIRGEMHNHYGYCTIGAIYACEGNLYSKWRAVRKLKAYLKGIYNRRTSILVWNDHKAAAYNVTLHIREAAKQ